ncbi:MAG: hypothetical protein K2M20_14055, partial [Lachnospiraceae bacterium]|nr:hypothetical protein [Lachnospiraceae bacterium]
MFSVRKQNPVSLAYINPVSVTDLYQLPEHYVIIQIHPENFLAAVLLKIVETHDQGKPPHGKCR